MPDEHRGFLVSFEKGEPKWSLLDVIHVEQHPAVQWRLNNLAKSDQKKPEQLAEGLVISYRNRERRNRCVRRNLRPFVQSMYRTALTNRHFLRSTKLETRRRPILRQLIAS